MSAKNPGKVVDAFAPVGTQPQGCDIKLGEFTAGTVLILQQIGHPILDGGEEANSKKTAARKTAARMTDEQVMQLVYVLAHPAEESFDLLALGRKAFDRAVLVFAGTLPLNALPELGAKVAAAFARAVSTVMPGASGADPEKKRR